MLCKSVPSLFLLFDGACTIFGHLKSANLLEQEETLVRKELSGLTLTKQLQLKHFVKIQCASGSLATFFCNAESKRSHASQNVNTMPVSIINHLIFSNNFFKNPSYVLSSL